MTQSEIARVIDRLKGWRKANKLSQAGAVAVLGGLGFEIRKSTIEKWESGVLRPGRFTVQVLAMFLEKHPEVECPPGYRTLPARLSAGPGCAGAKAEGQRGHAQGGGGTESTFGFSSVSRIVKGNRRAAELKRGLLSL